MNEEIKQLTGLQIIDLEIAKFDDDINAAKSALIMREKAFNENQAAIEELQEKIETAETQRRELEAQL